MQFYNESHIRVLIGQRNSTLPLVNVNAGRITTFLCIQNIQRTFFISTM